MLTFNKNMLKYLILKKKGGILKEEIKKYLNEFKIGTKKMFKEFFKKDTNKKQRANMWTFTRLISSFLIIICSLFAVVTMNPVLFTTSFGLTSFGALTDYFDGKSARKYNSFSDYGKLLDQVTDKVFSVLIGISLLMINPMYLTVLFGEGLIAGINIGYKIKNKNLKISSTQIGRVKQWPLFGSLAIGFLSPINNILLTISNISVVSVIVMQLLTSYSYILSNNKMIKETKSEDYNNDLLEESTNNEYENTLSFNKSNNCNSITNNRKEQIIQLRDLLNQVIVKENNITNNQYQLKK